MIHISISTSWIYHSRGSSLSFRQKTWFKIVNAYGLHSREILFRFVGKTNFKTWQVEASNLNSLWLVVGPFEEPWDTVAERLRRSTRNRLGLSRVGSSPAGVDSFLSCWIMFLGLNHRVLVVDAEKNVDTGILKLWTNPECTRTLPSRRQIQSVLGPCLWGDFKYDIIYVWTYS